jgi:hypothetical protein
MAMITRTSLVLNSVSVVRDVVTGTMGNGFVVADMQASMIPFSLRLQSQRYPESVQEPGQQHVDADLRGVDMRADRAGRPGSCAGILASRSFGQLHAPHALAHSGANPLRFTQGNWARKQRWAGLTGLKRAGGAPSASTRG